MKREELLKAAKPILFNTEMIKAILDGRKTVTRRLIKPHYRDDECGFQVVTTIDGKFIRVEKTNENGCGLFGDEERHVYPPYNSGDILYVREAWCKLTDWEEQYPDDEEDMQITYYRADYPEDMRDMAKWHPSIHMPKEAARIFLRVTDVRVERLQELEEGDARQEGFINDIDLNFGTGKSAKKAFAELWDSTVKKSDLSKYGWNANPFVWVIEFERVGV